MATEIIELCANCLFSSIQKDCDCIGTSKYLISDDGQIIGIIGTNK